MRALAAITILSVLTCLHAHSPVLDALKPLENILKCGLTLGPGKCLNALTAWRAERAIHDPSSNINIKDDLEQFPWNKYRNISEEQLYSEACDGAERLLRRKPLMLTMIPGYKFQLLTKENGTLNVDVYKNVDLGTGRSSLKKAKKTFYKIMPLLVLPGLIMSAILPFVLPALKMMTLAAGMLNNMALTGAVFTLLRNNAFNDNYEHKIVYVNEGYKNEKHAHHSHHNHHGGNDFDDYHFAESQPVQFAVRDTETIKDLPLDPNWIKDYYEDEHIVRETKRNAITEQKPS